MNNEKKAERKFTLTHGILIGGFVIVIAVICGIGYFMLKPEEEGSKGALVVNESNLARIQEMFAEPVDDGLFEVNMNTVWMFEDGSSPSSNAYLANGAANSLPLSFDIMLDEETIYTSTVIPVGNQIKQIILDKDLEAGEYAAVCQYHLWNEDGTENSSFGVNITLLIKN